MIIPCDIDAEKAILGAILLDNESLRDVIGTIDPGDFHHPGHRVIFEAILSVSEQHDPIDAVTVGTRLSDGDKQLIGGVAYLSILPDSIGSLAALAVYIRSVKECAIRREAILAADKLRQLCGRDDVSPSTIAELTDRIRSVEQLDTRKKAAVKLASGVGVALDGLRRFASGDNSDRVPIGVSKVDRALRGGMMAGALYLVGAPSGGGKTTLTQNVAISCAMTRGPVLWVSPEMTVAELTEREIIRRSGVSLNGRGPWVRFEEEKENAALHIQAAFEIERDNLDVYCIDDMNIGMTDVSARARGIRNLKLIIIDYAQEVADKDPKLARYLAVGNVGRDAIRIGRDFNCPVMVTSQVNQSKDGYTFRESGDLMQRAHVAFIMETKWSEVPDRHGYFQIESAKLISKKNRSGPKFSVDISYDPATYRINEFKKLSGDVWTPKETSYDQY